MTELIKMVVVLTILSASSGGVLAYLKDKTKDQIENQQLQFVKGPAIMAILAGSSNDPIADRFKLKVDDKDKSFFVGKFNGKANTIVFESFGKGYGGDVGLMVGINIETDTIVSVAVTTHSETPGLGAMAKDDPDFGAQFKGLTINEPFTVTNDGGKINALSGATITSRAVCAAATDVGNIYKTTKSQLAEKLEGFTK